MFVCQSVHMKMRHSAPCDSEGHNHANCLTRMEYSKPFYKGHLECSKPLYKGHCLLSQLHRAAYKTTSELGTPLYEGQTAGSQGCSIESGSTVSLNTNTVRDWVAGGTNHSEEERKWLQQDKGCVGSSQLLQEDWQCVGVSAPHWGR